MVSAVYRSTIFSSNAALRRKEQGNKLCMPWSDLVEGSASGCTKLRWPLMLLSEAAALLALLLHVAEQEAVASLDESLGSS